MTHATEILGTVLFASAVLHTFSVKKILDLSRQFPEGSTQQALLHLAGEVEVVFGLWASVFLFCFGALEGFAKVVEFQNNLHFSEPLFVFCILVMASTRPILFLARSVIEWISSVLAKILRLPQERSDLFVLMVVGPLSGSLITEPAAMTMTALLLKQMIKKVDSKLVYLILAVLFVNVSIGGALTSFAAPPILMVATKWGWGVSEVFALFGAKALLAVTANASLLIAVYWRNLDQHLHAFHEIPASESPPRWISIAHVVLLGLLVANAHHPNLAMGFFLLFLGLSTVTKQFQDPLRLRESLLVAFFLAGLVVFGPMQAWWLSPILKNLSSFSLFLGATTLTAITDNAALTYLGSQVEGLGAVSKYYLVAGAITGGGLTIIANAPNAAGYSILQACFPDGLNPISLLKAALVPTLVAFLSFSIF